jgi:UDP-glucuronate 4-epimerase
MKNILVTGGAGFIGSHLVDRILPDIGGRVVVVDNFDRFYAPEIKRANIAPYASRRDFELVEADICDETAMKGVFARGRFDCVIHLAAKAGVRPSLENPMAYEETNIRGTYVLLEAARRYSVPKFIFGSSSSVYGVNLKVPFSEADPLSGPISIYAATKLAGEAACYAYSHLYDLQAICLRFFTVYGARQRPDLAIHKFTRLITNDLRVPVFGDGSSRRDYTYIDDIIQGVVAALRYKGPRFEIFNLGESQTTELRGLIELLERVLGKKAKIESLPVQPGDVPVTFADISKARSLLDYNPSTDIEDGAGRFVKWYRETPTASLHKSAL